MYQYHCIHITMTNGLDLITNFLNEELERDMQNKKKEVEKLILNKETIGTDLNYKHEIVWGNVILFLILHTCGAYGFFLLFTGTFSIGTIIWALAISFILNMGITVGAHRYYTHKTFKAKPILQFIFIVAQTLAGQNAMFTWARDHRLHHRYSDTDGDPHNSKRGFFFCHMGWLMRKKHPLVIELGRRIDMSDMLADPLVMWQKRFYYHFYFLVAFLIPAAIPVYFFGETWTNSIMFTYFARYMFTLHATWLVNSAAHLYGTRPYDKKLQPVDSWFVSMMTSGEGWHNYHHAFPWDYKAAEETMPLNFSATVIRFFEKIGWAYDLKSVDPNMLKRRILASGDGTHYALGTDQSAVTAIGPLHPLNPTYTSKSKAPDATLKLEGLPLYHEKDLLNENNNNAEMYHEKDLLNANTERFAQTG